MTLSTGGAAGDRFVIEGGYPIGGSMTASGNKNEALPLLAASLLVPAPVHIENVPRIQDVETLVQIMRGLGVGVEFSADHAVECDASTVADFHPDAALASEIRGSFLLAAPLLARLGEAVLPRPGGDKIGRRRLDTHLLALRQLGAEPADGEGYHLVLDGRFRGTEVYLGVEMGDRYVERARREFEDVENVLVRMRPERWLTVDYVKEYGSL